jgi:hypothetical protein
MSHASPTPLGVIVKTVVTHYVTYFIMGLLASTLLGYAAWFAESSLNVMMRPVSDPVVMAGPLFQPIRGILFGVIFYLLREPFFGRRHGWLVMWATLVVLGILGTFGPTPSSIEGILFTTFPLEVHLKALPEVVLQSLFLSLRLFYWVNHPEKRWLSWVMGVAAVLFTIFPVLGLLVTQSR